MTALILLRSFLETQIEIWHYVAEAPDYEISSLGNLRSYRGKVRADGSHGGFRGARLHRPRRIKVNASQKNPYILVTLQTPQGEKTRVLHRLVAQAFIPDPANVSQVNHKNLIKQDNRRENLEWVTPRGNADHATASGVRPKGSEHGMARLTESRVRQIRERYVEGESLKQLSEVYKCTLQNIFRIVNRETWKHLD